MYLYLLNYLLIHVLLICSMSYSEKEIVEVFLKGFLTTEVKPRACTLISFSAVTNESDYFRNNC